MTAGCHTQVSRVLRVSHIAGFGFFKRLTRKPLMEGALRCHKVRFMFLG